MKWLADVLLDPLLGPVDTYAYAIDPVRDAALAPDDFARDYIVGLLNTDPRIMALFPDGAEPVWPIPPVEGGYIKPALFVAARAGNETPEPGSDGYRATVDVAAVFEHPIWFTETVGEPGVASLLGLFRGIVGARRQLPVILDGESVPAARHGMPGAVTYFAGQTVTNGQRVLMLVQPYIFDFTLNPTTGQNRQLGG